MWNDMTTIRKVKSNRKGFTTFAAFGIAMTLLAGCGQTGTSNMGDSSNVDAAVITPPGSSDGMNAQIDENNPYAAAGINNPTAFVKMFEIAKAAIAADEKKAVAELVLFPLQVNGENPVKITSKADFIEKYDQIITQSVKDALAAQKVEDLFVRDQGVMVGDGELWFGASAEEPQVYGIIAVNPS
ncbi:hypothetical protein BK133_06705 [Paenibacillus sp. FSL H8-0548]|uniref:hypothetical protein n=1 Tax=Paenibacillus sp. FSL H8-0548 TaxID=1920422 RepID=UPI00096CAD94|nr:hypothetical protein [Paenibacillus sp. FSL H8-0548]OMF37286.1 hypothetical protein BK133_06705 [Paenibacillus sp. FSL H8-0548]